MVEFVGTVRERVISARRRLAEAVAEHDPGALSGAVDELEEALRIARESGVDVPFGAEPESGSPG